MSVRMCLLGVLLTGALAGAAAAEDGGTAKWGQVGGWQIRVDRAMGDSCFALQGYEDGTWLRIGFDMKNRAVYFVLGNEAWRSLEAGKIYPVQFVFDDQKKYDGELTAFAWDDRVVLGHDNVGADFTTDFMERTGLRIYYRGSPIAGLSLRNTYAALGQAVNCQKEMLAMGGSPGSGARPASDPFSR